ncbi:FtsK/SpoIIIE domain-containing protein [Glutamicibacter sp.]|uniref:FHA domain-containing protein n=1 Tax=Glutamicibacter sp. TaxID=1931995 RepID=UPI0028BD5A4F|nr:FtsK/SpoIIIE domain-containing protein [Glutamicibacter sp.]
MQKYEVVVASRTLSRPHQFYVEANTELSGQQMSKILQDNFPNQTLFLGEEPLNEIDSVLPSQSLFLSDVPYVRSSSYSSGSALKLFVLEGQDAGAFIELTQGSHDIGRCAPLRLSDPQISRVHAVISVGAHRLSLKTLADTSVQIQSGTETKLITGETELFEGNTLLLGNTVLQIGEPDREDKSFAVHSNELAFELPEAPELGRLLTLCLASLIPVLSGVLLALFTRSLLFLAISGLSASLGLVPAGQLLVQRRAWKHQAMKLQAEVCQARCDFAPPLGTALIAGMSRMKHRIPSRTLPPLVFGKGTWNLPGSKVGDRQCQPRKRLKFPARTRQLTEVQNMPIFSPSKAETWQIVCDQNSSGAGLLYALIARFLPQIVSGEIKLLIDSSISALPPEVLLLRNVIQKEICTDPADNRLFPYTNLNFPARGLEATVDTIYLTAETPHPREHTLIIAVNSVLSKDCDYWVDPVASKAKLPDTSMNLNEASFLSADRFARIVQNWIDIQESTVSCHRKGIAAPNHNSLRANIGTDEKNEQQYLDFDVDGPHVLICGTTGSGKSEALRRVVSNLAETYGPQQIAFALIDFKGGAGLAAFSDLPQVQLFACDLDAPSAQRTLAQLEHEVRRRERVLAEHNCSDLFEYYELDLAAPMPRLLVVIDEFRVFAESIPLANERIDRLAAVGRSLGIHLLLSTQRAAGAITGQTKANINTIIALRVKDASESQELVGSTAAAHLLKPGSAVIARNVQRIQNVQFALAVPPSIQGMIAERGPNDLSLRPPAFFGEQRSQAESRSIQCYVEKIQQLWPLSQVPHCSFAPSLPELLQGISLPIPQVGDDDCFCGFLDNLEQGRLDPLVIGSSSMRGILACGVPESGGGALLQLLASRHPRVLIFGPSLFDPRSSPENVRCVTGSNRFEFNEALDYVESRQGKDRLLILVHGVANLQAQLDPRTFQRFDAVLMDILRMGHDPEPRLVLAVDRDQNLLKASTLCTEQWYFPLDATDALKMSWPKLPPCSQLVGRGVRIVSDSAPTVFQLVNSMPEESKTVGCGRSWPLGEHRHNDNLNTQLFVGETSFRSIPFELPSVGTSYFLCTEVNGRSDIAQELASRWRSELIIGIEAAENWLGSQEKQAYAQLVPVLCVELKSTADPNTAKTLELLATFVNQMVVFVPPSSRLAFDLGIPGGQLDERNVVIVEAKHPQDLLPTNWPPLPLDSGQQKVSARNQWRALVQISGQLHAINISRS